MKFFRWNFLLYVLAIAFSFVWRSDALNYSIPCALDENAQSQADKKIETGTSDDALMAYMIPQGSQEIVLVDIKSGLKGASIPLESPHKILSTSPNGQKVYIASDDLCEIQCVDVCTKTVKKLGHFKYPLNQFVLSKNEKNAYISYIDSNEIDCLNLENQQLVNLITLENIPQHMALDLKKERLYVNCYDSKEIISIDTSTSEILPFLSLESKIEFLTVSSNGSKIFAFLGENNQLATICAKTKSIELSQVLEGDFKRDRAGKIERVGLNFAGTHAYIVKECSKEIILINLQSKTVDSAINLNDVIASIDFYFQKNINPIFSYTSEDALFPLAVHTTTNLSPVNLMNPVNIEYGTIVTFHATVTGNNPTGSVTFMDGSIVLGIVNMTPPADDVRLDILLSGGTHSITAVYSGDVNNQGSTSNVVPVTVFPQSTSTVMSASPISSSYGQEVALMAYVTSVNNPNLIPTGEVSFTDTSLPEPDLGTVPLNSEGRAILYTSSLKFGDNSLVAEYLGSVSFISSSNRSTQGIFIYQVHSTSTSTNLIVNPNSSTFGESVTFEVTTIADYGTIPEGNVTFKDGTTELGTSNLNSEGKVNFSTDLLSVGAHSLSAVYNGTLVYNGSSSNSVNVQVNQASTTTSLASNINPSVVGEEIVLTATVSSPNSIPEGSVTFMDGAAVFGTSSLNSQGIATLTTASLSAGKHSLTAVYNGNENYQSSSSNSIDQQVGKVSTSTNLTSNINPSSFGEEITLTVFVSANDSTIPTGSVTFKDTTVDGVTTDLGTINVDSTGNATLSTSSLSAGMHSLTAVYNATNNYENSTSPVLSQQVNGIGTTTALTSDINPSFFGQLVTFSATVLSDDSTTATGIVIFRDKTIDGTTTLLGTSNLNSEGVATLSTNSLSAGAHSLTAIYIGSGNYESSISPALSQQVDGISTTTVLEVNINPSVFGEEIILSATISSEDSNVPLGTVTFRDGLTILGTSNLDAEGVATFSTSSLSTGTHLLTAVFLGSGNYESSISPIFHQQVGKASTATSLVSNNSSPIFGEELILTAIVSSGDNTVSIGNVTFMDGSIVLGISNVDAEGNAVFSTTSLSAGMHSLTATYNENEDYEGSTSQLNQRVVRADTTTTIISNVNPSTVGQEVILTATVSSDEGIPIGKVIFRDGTILLGISTLDSEGKAVFSTSSLSAGTHALTAVYVGINDYGSSISPLLNLQVDKAGTTTNLTTSANPSTVGQEVILTATVQSNSIPIGTVIFMDGTTTLGTVILNSEGVAIFPISSLSAGTHSLTAVYSESENYTKSTSNIVVQQVNKSNTTTTLTSSANPSEYEETIILTATISYEGLVPSGNVTFMNGGEVLGTSNLNVGKATLAVSVLGVGSHSLTAIYNGDANYNTSTSAVFIQTVESSFNETSTALTSSNNPAEFGTSVTFTANVSSLVGIPSGDVTFYDESVVLGVASLNQGVAMLTVSNLSLGNHRITASYNGNTQFNPSSSDSLLQIIYTSRAPQAPVNFRGVQGTNKFINTIEWINILSWDFPEDNWGIASFEVYRDAALTELVGKVQRADPLTLEDGNRKKNLAYTYYIVSVSSVGVKSRAVSTTVKPKKMKGHKFK